MIRAVIQGRLGKTPRVAEADTAKTVNRFWPAVCLLGAAIYFMAGWSLDPDGVIILLTMLLVMYRFWLAARRVGGHRFSFSIYVAVFIACCVAIAGLVWLCYDTNADTAALIGVLIGGIVVDAIDGSRRRVPSESSPQHMLQSIAEPILFKRPGADLPERFDPRYPFRSQSDEGIWAIDPDRRAVRVMLPSEDDLDILLPWDEPVRAVTLRRYSRRLMPLGGHIGPLLRGDRELAVTSGGDASNAWTHIFHFSGEDKELALRWRDAFESWMRQDRRAAVTTASPR